MKSLPFLIAATIALVSATPPGIPPLSTAQTALSSLPIRKTTTTSTPGYDRALFPHWKTHSGPCNTREYVLVRDGTNVLTNATTCGATAGTWLSPYDNKTWTRVSDVDIDHMVPLSNAWASGADTWSTKQREGFANDVEGPQLWVVTDNVNQAKGDKSPDLWRPEVEGFWCVYAKSWVAVKRKWALSVTEAEKSALEGMMGGCREGGGGNGTTEGGGAVGSGAGRGLMGPGWGMLVSVWFVLHLGEVLG
ncbi:hypothetical protein B0T16DRAFT_376073 [Cercophora newfieldiana]|uniref:GmrSD restriction endonucleases C-terminal domain-containing protein n=1 Tax=Cercophora newfieldiana TaxID=92897 RepID=A0AA39Y6M9_9PEZI|nr:hypothetical protein B0T16DRAFT_376073 [Cercophora newfieldiana]